MRSPIPTPPLPSLFLSCSPYSSRVLSIFFLCNLYSSWSLSTLPVYSLTPRVLHTSPVHSLRLPSAPYSSCALSAPSIQHFFVQYTRTPNVKSMFLPCTIHKTPGSRAFRTLPEQYILLSSTSYFSCALLLLLKNSFSFRAFSNSPGHSVHLPCTLHSSRALPTSPVQSLLLL